jgi:hypothetical protein
MKKYTIQKSKNTLGKKVFYIMSYKSFLGIRYTGYKRESVAYFDVNKATEALKTFFLQLYVGT